MFSCPVWLYVANGGRLFVYKTKNGCAFLFYFPSSFQNGPRGCDGFCMLWHMLCGFDGNRKRIPLAGLGNTKYLSTATTLPSRLHDKNTVLWATDLAWMLAFCCKPL
jgi:hypothetical protein